MKKTKNQSQKPHIDYDGQWKLMIVVFEEELGKRKKIIYPK